jgi:hypothetical protein
VESTTTQYRYIIHLKLQNKIINLNNETNN